jgi:PleD family two-component response regulator
MGSSGQNEEVMTKKQMVAWANNNCACIRLAKIADTFHKAFASVPALRTAAYLQQEEQPQILATDDIDTIARKIANYLKEAGISEVVPSDIQRIVTFLEKDATTILNRLQQ